MGCNNSTSSTKFLEDMMQGDMKAVYESFLDKMPEKGIILDVGCGSGRDSLYFKEMGHMVLPMDTSEQICEMAGERIGQAVLFCRFQDVHFQLPFDGIWACGSLVHMPSEELTHILSHLRYCLKPNGTLYTSFIYGDIEEDRNGEFYLELTEGKASDILGEAGYNVDKMWITEDDTDYSVNKKWLNILANKRL